MNRLVFITLVLAVVVAGGRLPATAGEAELQLPTDSLNRFRLTPGVAFNVTARFQSLPNLISQPVPRTTPNGDRYNYDNGYVLTDVSGNAGGQTWYWGYDASTQISGNTILMSRTTSSATTAAEAGAIWHDSQFHAELVYDREFGTFHDVHYGLEAAVSYMYVSLRDTSVRTGDAVSTTDAFPFTPGTTPPAAPYQGTFNGPGFVIGATPASSTSTVTPGVATVSGTRDLSAHVLGLRVGPYIEWPLATNLDCSLSAGVAVAVLDTSASWTETVNITGGGITTTPGSGQGTDAVFGGYLGANISWRFLRNWSAEASVQYMALGTSSQTLGGRVVDLDLSRSILVMLGVGWRF